MRIMLSAVIVVVLGLLCSQTAVFGQVNRSSSSSGLFGDRTVGGGTSELNRSFGGSGAAGGLSSTSAANVGQVDSSDRFVRGSRRPGQFVGTDRNEAQTFTGTSQAGGNVSAGSSSGLSAGGIGGARGGNRSGGAGRNQRARTDVRISLRVAFDYPKATSSQISATLVRRLTNLQQIRTLSGVEILVNDGTAVLRGVVATEHERALSERLVLLEAGVWDVKNELVVAQVPVGLKLSLPAEPAEQTPAVAEEPAAAEKPATVKSPAVESPVAEPPSAD